MERIAMKILICDDKPRQCERTQNAIGSVGDIEGLAGTDLKNALTSLFGDVSRVLNGSATTGQGLDGTRFDGFDVVIVDNNLTGLELDGARLTAETIIGYLRGFTDVPYIVSLNKNIHVDFDLRYLFGDYQSLADLALNIGHLSHPCLWERTVGQGSFAPWYWPPLGDAVRNRRMQIESLERDGTLDRPVWDFFGFPPEAEDYLAPRARAALFCGELGMREVTFRSFFDTSRVMPPGEIEALRSMATHEGPAHRAVCRIAAYEVDRWLRRDVLGTQDVLIDVPHLIAQMPIVLGARQGELDAWNRAAIESRPPFALDQAIFADHLKGTCFNAPAWAPVPCFWWPKLRANRTLSELFFNSDAEWPDAVFCEDVSQFVPVAGTGDCGPPLEFESEIDGSWPRRFVCHVDPYQYSPRSRIVGRASGA